MPLTSSLRIKLIVPSMPRRSLSGGVPRVSTYATLIAGRTSPVRAHKSFAFVFGRPVQFRSVTQRTVSQCYCGRTIKIGFEASKGPFSWLNHMKSLNHMLQKRVLMMHCMQKMPWTIFSPHRSHHHFHHHCHPHHRHPLSTWPLSSESLP